MRHIFITAEIQILISEGSLLFSEEEKKINTPGTIVMEEKEMEDFCSVLGFDQRLLKWWSTLICYITWRIVIEDVHVDLA